MSADEVPGALRYALGVTPRPPTGATAPPELAALGEHDRVLMVVGPGVLAAGAVEGLRTFAAAANVGVANTFGAKGVFRWDSPHHLGTYGLQVDDFALLNAAAADLVITSGLDPAECPPGSLGETAVVEVAPEDLEVFARDMASCAGDIEPTELYRRIAAIAGPGYTDERFPRHPAAAISMLRDEYPDVTVIAEPGLAGFWIGRMFPTERPGAVIVPARGPVGIAYDLAELAHQAGLGVVVVDVADDTTDRAFPVVSWAQGIDHSVTDALVTAAGRVTGLNGERIRDRPTR